MNTYCVLYCTICIIPSQMYSPQHDKWHYVGDLPEYLLTSDIAIFVRGDYLYVAGGYKQNYEATARTYRIQTDLSYQLYERNPDNKKQLVVETLANMNAPRGSIHGAMYGTYGFVAGGYSHTNHFCEPLYSSERYHIDNDEWHYIDNLRANNARSNAALIKYDGKFLIMGGDARTDTEACMAEAEEADQGVVGVGSEDQVQQDITISTAVESVETFDPLDGPEAQWSMLRSDKMEGRMRFGAKAWPATNAVYVFGGFTDGPEGCNCYFASNRILIYQPSFETDDSRFVVWGVSVSMALLLLCTIAIVCCRRKRQRRYVLDSAVADDEKQRMMRRTGEHDDGMDSDDDHDDDEDDGMTYDDDQPGFELHKKKPSPHKSNDGYGYANANNGGTNGDDDDLMMNDDDDVNDDEFFDNYLHRLDSENDNHKRY
jgi:hypothetical protein